MLAAPDFTRPFKIEVDASMYGAGAMLIQEDHEGADHLVCYFSKKVLSTNFNTTLSKKDALALLWALQHFEIYVGSSPTVVQVFTDHKPLVFCPVCATTTIALCNGL